MKQRTWELQEQDEAVVASLQQGLGVSPVIARLLCNRGLTTVQKAKDFLNKSIDSLYDPLLIPDMDKAVARIEQAKKSQFSGIMTWTASPLRRCFTGI